MPTAGVEGVRVRFEGFHALEQGSLIQVHPRGVAAFISRHRTTRIAIRGPEAQRKRLVALLEGIDGVSIEDASRTALRAAMGGALTPPDVAIIVAPLGSLHVEFEAVRGPTGLPGILVLVPEHEIEKAARTAPVLGISVLPVNADGEAILAALHGAAHRLITVPRMATPADPENEPLTEQQRRVLVLIAEGRSNKEISRALGISSNTTKFHVAALLKRLGVGTRTEAVAVGLRTGLIAA